MSHPGREGGLVNMYSTKVWWVPYWTFNRKGRINITAIMKVTAVSLFLSKSLPSFNGLARKESLTVLMNELKGMSTHLEFRKSRLLFWFPWVRSLDISTIEGYLMLNPMYISSSSYRAGSTDIPDPLSPLLPIVHRPRKVFRTTSRILT